MSFSSDRRGTTAITFAVVFLPTTLMIGSAVDFGRAIRAEQAMQGVADAAVMAAATTKGDSREKAEAAARGIFDQVDWTEFVQSIEEPQLSVPETDRYRLTLTAKIDTAFMALVGFDEIDVAVSTEAIRGISGSVEMALVLDTTYSMTGTKIASLKTAANALIDTLAAQPDADIAYSVVPFGQYVNVGVANRTQPWINVGADYSTTANVCTTTKPVISKSGCTTVSTIKYNDGVPYTTKTETCTSYVYGDPVKTCKNQTTNYKFNGCVGSRQKPHNVTDKVIPGLRYPGLFNVTCATEMLPLTETASTAKAKINSLTVAGETYIPAGLMWGLNALSPTEPFTNAAGYDLENRAPRKVLVLMTDGDNTKTAVWPSGTHTGADGPDADTFTANLCDSIKAARIEVFTVAFQVTDDATVAMLRSCATSPENAFTAADSAALVAAFADIAVSLKTPRLVM